MLLAILLAAAPPAQAPAAPTARAVVERQLAARPRVDPPAQSAAESERIRARRLERIGQKLQPSADEGQDRR